MDLKRKHEELLADEGAAEASVSRVRSFPIGNVHTYNVVCDSGDATEDPPAYLEWFVRFNAAVGKAEDGKLKAAVGLDCEWAPPWWREDKPERVDTIQLYSPHAGVLIFSTGSLNQLPVAFEALFADERIALVGVNVNGDGARLARDFKCTVNGLLNVALRKAKTSMEDLAAAVCPREFRVKKDSIESKVRLSNWAQWPLTELQLKYASLDAVLSFAIFFFQQFDRNKTGWDDAGAMTTDSIAMEGLLLQTQHPEESNGKVAAPRETNNGAHGHFFIMHRNRSIVPPNLEKKVHPTGTANALDGVVAIISGVLDSMSRDEMTKYIQRHGGKVVKSVTNSTTMLINDHGTVGPSKRKKIEAKNIPIVSEDVIFDMVRKSSIP